jgi:hypothetical protein
MDFEETEWVMCKTMANTRIPGKLASVRDSNRTHVKSAAAGTNLLADIRMAQRTNLYTARTCRKQIYEKNKQKQHRGRRLLLVQHLQTDYTLMGRIFTGYFGVLKDWA